MSAIKDGFIFLHCMLVQHDGFLTRFLCLLSRTGYIPTLYVGAA